MNEMMTIIQQNGIYEIPNVTFDPTLLSVLMLTIPMASACKRRSQIKTERMAKNNLAGNARKGHLS